MPHYAYHKTLGTTLVDNDVVIVKRPEFEGDDYLFSITGNTLPTGEFTTLECKVDTRYLHTKRAAFELKNTTPSVFDAYVNDRPSLRSLNKFEELDATIYTIACERANGKNYEECIDDVKSILASSTSTRRGVLRFANPVSEYAESVVAPRDVTCLSMIHYLEDHCKLIFRASDVKNEIIIDLLTINEFFVAPVYNEKTYRIVVYASTAQGIEHFDKMTNELSRISDARSGL